jgi:hypothetical protein
VEKFFKQLGKDILAFMPWEDALPGYTNQNKVLIVEQPNTQWIKILRVLLGRLADLKPGEKHWATTVAAPEFTQGDFMERPFPFGDMPVMPEDDAHFSGGRLLHLPDFRGKGLKLFTR